MVALDAGQISLRMYPHAIPIRDCVAEMLRQAQLAEEAGFDGLMTSEHHGGFPGYLPDPLQVAGFLLDVTKSVWAAPCPLLLPLYHWSHIVERLAWMGARFPDRVAAGFAIGGLPQDFEMADLAYDERIARFKEALPLAVGALRGEASEPLAKDPAVAACGASPIPAMSAAQSPGAVRRAAKLGIGVLYDSLQTVERTRELSDAYLEAGGTATRLAIRRVWVGEPPAESVDAQMKFYRGYASESAKQHWGEDKQLVTGADGAEVAEKLLEIAEQGGCDAFNLRVHLTGLEPARVEEQIARLGAETLPIVRQGLGGQR